MNLKKFQLSVVLFFLLVVLVRATIEDTPVEPSIGNTLINTTSLPEAEQPTDINSPKEIPQEDQSVDLPQETDQTPSVQNELSQDEDMFNGLQPSLPGPKPERGIDNPPGSEQGENWERTCNTITCMHTIYPYQKYYQTNGNWHEIDKHFYSSPCQNNYDFCVVDNLYQVQMQAYTDGIHPFSFTRDGLSVSFKPLEASYRSQEITQTIGNVRHSPSQVQTNEAQYSDVFVNGIDLTFHYLPRMFKEDLILSSRDVLPAVTVAAPPEEITFDLSFALTTSATINVNNATWNQRAFVSTQETIAFTDGATSFYFIAPLAYDAAGAITRVTYLLSSVNNTPVITLQVPYAWLIDSGREYPVHIDPTLSLDGSSSMTWDGYISHNDGISCPAPPDPCNDPSRNGLGSIIFIGDNNNSPAQGYTTHRADLDWDLSSLPDSVHIEDMQLSLFIGGVDSNNNEFRFRYMHGGNSLYANDDAGNTAFYTDAGDGTEYLRKTVIANQMNTFNLTNSSQFAADVEMILLNGTDQWSIGITTPESRAANAQPTNFTSSEGNDGELPTLQIIYQPFANETEGDTAIEQGIMNVLGANAVIQDTQQVYIHTTNSTQQLGTFDKFTLNESKRWGINYVTSGETSANMVNLSATVYFSEMVNLMAADITQRVQDFINGTA